MKTKQKIPVVLDTDIGNDIDDTWALGQLLRTPELDLKLVLTSTGDTEYRARVAAKFLRDAGYGHVPVGVGIPRADGSPESLHEYVKHFRLSDYPGAVYADGIGKALELMGSCDGLTLIGIAPATNLAELVARSPDLAKRTRLTAMLGSVDWQHDGRPGAVAEYNVTLDLEASRRLFRSEWREFLITPLDHCGVIRLRGEEFRRVFHSPLAIPRGIIEQYALWRKHWGKASAMTESSILYDTAAVALAASADCAELETMRLEVTPDGFLRRSSGGNGITVAVRMPDPGAFHERLLSVLLNDTPRNTGLTKGQCHETEFHAY